jgi:(2Fe-2S) ferredoxin/predicted O-methyltransferase YrrM
MEPFRYHVFACEQRKPDGTPCGSARGSAATLDALRREVLARGLDDEVQVTTCGSIGLCEHGPNLIVYPDGIWYCGVTPADVPEIVESHFRQDRPVERLVRSDEASVRAEILANREKTRKGMRVREAAGALPEDLNDLIRGFQESRAILTGLELDFFSAVADGATAARVAERAGAHRRATETLLHALTALGLLTKDGETFRNTPAAARWFTTGSPDSARLALLHMSSLWPRWSTLTDCVRAGTSVTLNRRDAGPDTWTEPFIAAMHRNARDRAVPVVAAVGAGEVRRMLDVGGGSGAYSIAFAQANPGLVSEILDLETVAPIAQRHIAEAGVQHRVCVRVADLTRDDLGAGYDLVFISAICHMLGPEENRDLLSRAGRALAHGGRVVVQDFILDSSRTSPRFAAMFALNMLVGTRAGSSYSEADYAEWLTGAGFTNTRRVNLPGPTGVMIAARP